VGVGAARAPARDLVLVAVRGEVLVGIELRLDLALEEGMT
jgi:hypothetical protein